MLLTGSYSLPLVLASYVVAVAAAFAALNTAARIARGGRRAVWWLVSGGIAMGTGIWSMHFIGMLAFQLPIPQGYDLAWTLYSLAISIATSTYALWQVAQAGVTTARLVIGALVLGGGIACMHYAGMASMQMQPAIDYHPGWLVASILIAVVAAGAALQIAYALRQEKRGQRRTRLVAALVMGFAIVGMHYTGMAAARFDAASVCGAALANGMSRELLAVLVGVCSAMILGAAITVSILERNIEERSLRASKALAEVNEQLSLMAWYDPLTGLPNRLLLQERLAGFIRASEASGRPFAVLFVDLDGFKGINDAFGHDQGDQVLAEVAARIGRVVGEDGTVARLGGDEFVVLADVEDAPDADQLATQLASQIDAGLEIDAGLVKVSASIGIALFPFDGVNARQLLANADSAMYHVKERGRNGHGFYNAELHLDVHAQMALVQDLRGACQRGELFLVYQPKVRAPDRAVIGVEALVRWRHPVRGLVMPDVFIPLAERYGMIIELGAWVLREACSQLAQWRSEGFDVPHIAVNLSAVQFRSAVLIDEILHLLHKEGLRGEDLLLEITETMALQDPETSLSLLTRLSSMGVRISIDDFGVGYSSLDYLKRLPACELKIDRSFVRDVVNDHRDAAIVEMVVGLGRRFGLDVIAEGVETEAQWDALVLLGCERMQGYLIGYPVGGAAFGEQLRNGRYLVAGARCGDTQGATHRHACRAADTEHDGDECRGECACTAG